MIAVQRDGNEYRVLVLAFAGKDAALTSGVLLEAGHEAVACHDLAELRQELERGAGVVLLPEEIIAQGRRAELVELLTHQPLWSDLPILVFARPGADSAAVARAMDMLGNVTVIERPTRKAALVSAVRAALRGRERQYQARAHFLEREQRDASLREVRQQLETVTDMMAVAVARCSRDLRYVWVSRECANWFDRTPESMAGQAIVGVIGEAAFAVIRPYIERALAGERVEFEAQVPYRDRQRWIQAIYVPTRAANGEVDGWVASIADLTSRKELEESLRVSDRRKDEFLAVLAHELRNPLAPIRNSVQVLRMLPPGDPETARVLEMMDRQMTQMVRLVDDLLEVARISRGLIDLRVELIDLEAVLRSAIETSGPALEAARHQVSVKLPDGPLLLQGDPVRLAQVFGNLLNNAAKYTPPGGHVEISARVDDGRVAVSVRDDGQGIPAEELPRVFDMFLQLRRGTDHVKQGGLGIGLGLARRLVAMHGGTIDAHSAGRGKGSEFVVRLPLASGATAPAPAPRRESRPPAHPQRVLVVDDNRDAGDSLALLLRMRGANVEVAQSGRTALEAMRTGRPGLVLLDLGMPGMDGFEVARRMRASPEGRDAVLVALTGWGQEQDRSRTRAAGFDHHLVKPADLAAIEALLASLEFKPIPPAPALEDQA